MRRAHDRGRGVRRRHGIVIHHGHRAHGRTSHHVRRASVHHPHHVRGPEGTAERVADHPHVIHRAGHGRADTHMRAVHGGHAHRPHVHVVGHHGHGRR